MDVKIVIQTVKDPPWAGDRRVTLPSSAEEALIEIVPARMAEPDQVRMSIDDGINEAFAMLGLRHIRFAKRTLERLTKKEKDDG